MKSKVTKIIWDAFLIFLWTMALMFNIYATILLAMKSFQLGEALALVACIAAIYFLSVFIIKYAVADIEEILQEEEKE